MLTENQIKELQPLTEHPKYGNLLKDAVEVWKRENVIPCCKGFGVFSNNENKFVFDNENNQCCLVGAAILANLNNISRDHYISRYRFMNNFYHLSKDELDDLWTGFDSEYDCNSNIAWQFGREIRKIVNPFVYMKDEWV